MGFLSKEYFRNEYREALVTIQVLGKKALQYLPSKGHFCYSIREEFKVIENLMAIVNLVCGILNPLDSSNQA